MKTFGDQKNQLIDSFIIESNRDRVGRLSSIAIRSAYEDLSARTQWNYLKRRTQLNMTAPYSTGTVAYNATTGILTLSGGTFPTWVTSGELLINRNVYIAHTRTDSTHVVLQADRRPAADLAAGTSYQLVKTSYLLPVDFVELRGITETERLWSLAYLSPEQMLARSQLWFNPSNSVYYTIMGGPNGRMVMQFNPPPSFARTMDMIYQAKPRPPVLLQPFTNGTIAATAGSSTVTITPGSGGATTPTSLDGCVLRIGGTLVPSGPFTDTPPVEEHVIASVSGNVLTLQDTVGATVTAARFSIDDPLDFEPGMMSYFDRMCEARLLRLHQSAIERVRDAELKESEALRQARAADSRMNPAAVANSLIVTGINEALMGMTGSGGTS